MEPIFACEDIEFIGLNVQSQHPINKLPPPAPAFLTGKGKQMVPKSFNDVCKRAAGRRRHLADRRAVQDERRLQVLDVLLNLEWQSYGVGRVLAKNLSVDAATISRDIQFLRNWREHLIETKRTTFFSPRAELINVFGISW
jgi:hypothetical protein